MSLSLEQAAAILDCCILTTTNEDGGKVNYSWRLAADVLAVGKSTPTSKVVVIDDQAFHRDEAQKLMKHHIDRPLFI